MRLTTAAASALASAGLLASAWHLGTAPGPQVSATGPDGTAVATSAPATGGRTSSTATSARAKRVRSTKARARTAPTTTAARRSFPGSLVQTRYGDVQVSVVTRGTRIVDVMANRLTDSSPHSSQLSAGAAPTLRQEVLAAQSTRVDAVSGATYTSQAYLESVQAALDAAHL